VGSIVLASRLTHTTVNSIPVFGGVEMAFSDTGRGHRLRDDLNDVDYDELGFMDDSEDDPDYSGSDDISEVGYLEERQVNQIGHKVPN